jgi:hypothetical protein
MSRFSFCGGGQLRNRLPRRHGKHRGDRNAGKALTMTSAITGARLATRRDESFGAEGLHGVDGGRAARREIRGEQADREQDETGNQQKQWIAGIDSI